MDGEFRCVQNKTNIFGHVYFELESHIGDKMVWSAVVPTIFDVDEISVKVDLTLNSDVETLHDIDFTQVQQDEVVTFFRWIFIKVPEMSELDIDNFEDYFSTPTVRVVPVGLEDSISIHLDELFTSLFSENTHVIQNSKMVKRNVWNYTKFIPLVDYQNLTEDQIKSKLNTTLIHFFEEFTLYDYIDQFLFECSLDETGRYLQVDLYLK